MAEYELVFRIPVDVFSWRVIYTKLLGSYNAARMRGFAKNTIQVVNAKADRVENDMLVTITVQQRGTKWARIRRFDSSYKDWVNHQIIRMRTVLKMPIYESVNWRKVFFRKYGKYQISGPRL